MNLKPVVGGLATFVPGVNRLLARRGTGGTSSAAYAYGVWLKHLTLLGASGGNTAPKTIAELGPGDSLGIGLAAMLSGVDYYSALEVVPYANPAANLAVLEGLLQLYRERAPRPHKGWPDFDMHLDARLFPSAILSEARLATSLAPDRVERIRQAVRHPGVPVGDIVVRYVVPWSDAAVIERGTVDLVLSHSVLEHVVDIEATYRAMYEWLRPGGTMSHQIDFESHGLSELWNGYRAYPEILWRIIVGRRPFLINRQPVSVHLEMLQKQGLRVVTDMRMHRADGILRSELAPAWRQISDDDLSCAGAFIQACKGY